MSKKRAVFTIIACSIAVLFLGGILMVGLNSDGFGLLRASAHGDRPQPYGFDNLVELDPEDEPLEKLEISWEAGPVLVKVVPGGKIRITETSSRLLEDNEQMQVGFGSGTLSIDWDHNRFRFFSFNLFGFGGLEKSLTLELPQALAQGLEEVDCSTISGDLEVGGLTAEEGEFSSVSGDIHLAAPLTFSDSCSISTTSGDIVSEGLTAQAIESSSTSGSIYFTDAAAGSANASTTSGEIYYGGKAEVFSTETVSGLCHGALSACPEEVDMDSVSGSLTLELPSSACFTAGHDTISGQFSCGFPSQGGQESENTYGTGRPAGRFHFSTTSGNIQILEA